MRNPSRTASVAIVLVALFWGCGAKLGRPPIECTYRKSLLGAGNILRLENQSHAALGGLRVEVRSADGDVIYEQAQLGSFEILEVGWKKLNGFEIPDDAVVVIRADGFLLPLRVELAASE